MTYLELVNGVLTRLREPMTTTVLRKEEPVVNLAKDFVNDAKRQVEAAHRWNATRNVWVVETSPGQASYVLPESSGGCTIEAVATPKGRIYQYDITRVIPDQGTGRPYKFAVDGTDNDGNISIRFSPIPDAKYAVDVLGWKSLPDLKNDGDELRLPDQPVLYYALALAARERGEVGGQTAQELFSMAQQYIRDAIALDATLSPTEQMWVAV